MKMKRHSYSIIYWKNKAKGLLELPTCKDDPVDLMPQVKGRTHVVGLQDMPEKQQSNMIISKSGIAGTISLFMI